MKRIMIFGVTGYAKYVRLSLEPKTCQVIAYIDNNKELQGKVYNGSIVIAPEDIHSYVYDYIITAHPKYDKEMIAQLKQLSVSADRIISPFYQNNWCMWQEPRFAMMRNCIEQICCRNILGNIAEVGVYQGEFAEYLNLLLPDRKIYLFDTFEGFSEKDRPEKEISERLADFRDTDIDMVLKRMRYPEMVEIRKGWFPATIDNLEDTFCFVSLDADLYEPIIQGLKYFYPRLNNGGYIFIHDFESTNWPGVKKAVYDFCNEYEVSFVPILDRCLSAIITK